MKTFTLKFTPENLQRHLAQNPNEMWTVRDEFKGTKGDLTSINGDLWEMKDFVIKPTTGQGVSLRIIAVEWYPRCGFADPFEMLAEICRCYGKIPEYLYFLNLVRVKGMR